MLSFRDINVDRISDVEHLIRWANDSTIRHLFRRFTNKEQYERPLQFDFAQRRLRQSIRQGRLLHLIERNGAVVGQLSLEIDCQAIIAPRPGTAWIGLVLGEKSARGQGLGRQAMLHAETIAAHRGAKQVQLGVFEFNMRARRLYEKLGYRSLCTTPNSTWWNNAMWSDIRLGKNLK